MTQSPGSLRRVQVWVFLFPQCSLLLKCCCSWCSLFFTGKQILLCCSIGAETVRRDTISVWDGDRARAGQDNYLLGLFYTQFLHVKSEWGDYKVNVGNLSNGFKLCYPLHLYLSAEPQSFNTCTVKGAGTPSSGQKHRVVQWMLRCSVK